MSQNDSVINVMTDKGNHPDHLLSPKITHSDFSSVKAMLPSTHSLNTLDKTSDVIQNSDCSTTEVVSHAGLNNGGAIYAATIPADLAENLPEGTVFQIMPAAAVWTIASSVSFHEAQILAKNPGILNGSEKSLQQNNPSISNVSSTLNEQIAVHLERKVTDLDLSFLNDADDEPSSTCTNVSSTQVSENLVNSEMSTSSENIKVCASSQQIDSNVDSTGQNEIAENTDSETVVMVDISRPIQLSQNSLIVVDGKKCVLQQDLQTGSVVAYPVAEPEKPKKKRGRPKKIVSEIIENHSTDGKVLGKVNENMSDNETISNNGLLEVSNADGTLVRRSSRKRKRTELLKDYETGNLNQEIGSDLDEIPQIMKHNYSITQKKLKQRNIGQTKKEALLTPDNRNNEQQFKRKVGRPRRYHIEAEQSQSFLIQTADGQQIMIQVPLSSIPSGMSLQDVAQDIADKINFEISLMQNPSPSNGTELSESTTELAVLCNETTINNSSMDESLPLRADITYSCAEINIGSDIEREPKEQHSLPQNSTIDTDKSFHAPPSSSEINSSCNIIEITNPPQSNLNELECTLPYSESLTDFSSSCVSKLVYSAKSEGTGSILSIPEIVVNDECESSSHSTDNNCIPACSDPSTLNSPTSCNDVDGTTIENDLMTDIGVSEEIVYSSSIVEDTEELSRKHANKSTNSKIYQNDIYTSGEKVILLKCDDQVIPLSDNKNIDTIDANSAEIKKDDNIKSSVNSITEDSELFLRNTNALSPSSVSTVTQNNCVCEQSVSDYFYDNNVQKSSSNCVTLTSIDGMVNSCNIEMGNDLQNKSTDLKLSQTTSPVKTNNHGSPKERFSDIKDDKGCENYVLPTSPLKTCSLVPIKNVPFFLPKPSDNTKFTSETYQCSKCGFQTIHDFEYQQHFIVHLKLKECKQCLFVCNEKEDLIEHYKECHPRWFCIQCSYIAECASAMKEHINKHMGTSCSCVICGKTYKDQYILKMHVKLVHLPVEVLFKCHLCEKQFNRKAHLKRHLRIHDPNKPFRCFHCEYSGCEKSDVTKHMLIHDEPKHECEYCGKAFRHLKNKELHVKRHKNQRDYKCGLCEFFGYTFTDVRKHIEKKHQINNQCETLILVPKPPNEPLLQAGQENKTQKKGTERN